MRSHANLLKTIALALCIAPAFGAHLGYRVYGADPGAWPKVLGSVGLAAQEDENAPVIVVRAGAQTEAAQLRQRVERGAIVVFEGESPAAAAFGFRASAEKVSTRSIIDVHQAQMPIIWQEQLELPVFRVPAEAVVFAKERWRQAPVSAGMKIGNGAVLWVATDPGAHGYDRFPYLLQSLHDLGLEPPFASKDLWAFFDSAYRSRADLDYLAERWRKAGISTLHVAGWHYFEPDKERDAYLQQLILACHKQAILVYVWMELPHVSEQFWQQHPEWREKTATQQDAQLDWRKLMNLQNRDCFKAVALGSFGLIQRFDWDGVNLAELYFESLEGAANPARFTPLNRDVRLQFSKSYGFDPAELFQANSQHAMAGHPEDLQKFLHYRARLAQRMQEEWMEVMRYAQEKKPHLEVVLTHVDDRYDTRMRDLIGADASRVLPMLDQSEFTFLIEDPATIWHLGPDRYQKIATSYGPLTPHQDRLAIDINIVERYQDVYPTKQQTGAELFQLVHMAAKAFPRVALYFENSLLTTDLPLLPSAAAVVDQARWQASQLIVSTPGGVGVPWQGPVQVDGRAWPVTNGAVAWIPPGRHTLETAASAPDLKILHFNGRLQSAQAAASRVDLSYRSDSRALAMLSAPIGRMEVDGEAAKPQIVEGSQPPVLMLPRGTHAVKLWLEAPVAARSGAPLTGH